MRTAIILLAFASQAAAEKPFSHFMLDLDLASRPPAAISEDRPSTSVPRPAVVLEKPKPKLQVKPGGYLWTFEEAKAHKKAVQLQESFAEYVARTGKLPPEASPQCSTGFCGTFSSRPTIATGGCGCGCVASLCGCHHSANAGKPLSAQLYQPGRVVRGRR